jgi:hypothetical protein
LEVFRLISTSAAKKSVRILFTYSLEALVTMEMDANESTASSAFYKPCTQKSTLQIEFVGSSTYLKLGLVSLSITAQSTASTNAVNSFTFVNQFELACLKVVD